MTVHEEEFDPLEIVIAWTESYGEDFEWDEVGGIPCINFSYRFDGYLYTATARVHQNNDEEKIRVCVVLELSNEIDELELYRHISDLQLVIPSGALVYNHEIGVLIHREDFFPEEESSMGEEVENFGYMLESSHAAFSALREVLAPYFGESVEDARLSGMPVLGSA